MIDDLGKLLDRVSSPADLAVILIVGPLGFVLDAGLDVVGFMPSGYVAITVASVALGVKKAIDVRRDSRRELRWGRAVRVRATALSEHLGRSRAPVHLAERLEGEINLYERGLATEAELEKAVTDCLADFRRWTWDARNDEYYASRGVVGPQFPS